jgi:hypothetical protein
LPARDCDLLCCKRFASDRGVSITWSASNITVARFSDRWSRGVSPLAETHVHFGHFPMGRLRLYIATPHRLLSVAALFDLREDCVSNPLSESDLSLKSNREKTPRPEELDSGSASLESKFSTLRLLLLRAADSLDG